MENKMTLLILAAGMGSRFGGLKQVEAMGPNDEFIIDYSIYDAIKAGFDKVVFIIKEENYELFKQTIGKRVEPHIKVEYAFQKMSDIPAGYEIPEERIKPLGTAHAIYCCRNNINTPFAIINADDFYGKDAFFQAAKFLKFLTSSDNHYGLVGYLAKNTMTENGSVKRGVCQVQDGYLAEIVESKLYKEDGIIIAEPLNKTEKFTVAEDETVSMNMLLFTPTIFNYIEEEFKEFFDTNCNDLTTCEFLIPDVLQKTIKTNKVDCKVIPTTATWYGVTYKEDTDYVKEGIKSLVDAGEYKNNLWN